MPSFWSSKLFGHPDDVNHKLENLVIFTNVEICGWQEHDDRWWKDDERSPTNEKFNKNTHSVKRDTWKGL